eukprot:gnl/TRDRNA2_/TRDRNA2_94455_c0_seq1.p1 gnl/TRDRNA2_/TRDRNA2_94455_c0~~gnl/TRDRNA2_/TRDRNA2_94455_c0_seq1.p1  ORF type:complete len:299 (-),score=16.02 gnl/TRDRNA2_/TRDRNA2_94455_c0_seq1:72-911(-)
MTACLIFFVLAVQTASTDVCLSEGTACPRNAMIADVADCKTAGGKLQGEEYEPWTTDEGPPGCFWSGSKAYGQLMFNPDLDSKDFSESVMSICNEVLVPSHSPPGPSPPGIPKTLHMTLTPLHDSRVTYCKACRDQIAQYQGEWQHAPIESNPDVFSHPPNLIFWNGKKWRTSTAAKCADKSFDGFDCGNYYFSAPRYADADVTLRHVELSYSVSFRWMWARRLVDDPVSDPGSSWRACLGQSSVLENAPLASGSPLLALPQGWLMSITVLSSISTLSN